MRVDWKKLRTLSVETKLGVVLGKVKDCVLETEGQNILQYEVGSMIGKNYLINRNQVLSIDDKKMVVEDSVVEIKSEIKKLGNKIEMDPVMMDEIGN